MNKNFYGASVIGRHFWVFEDHHKSLIWLVFRPRMMVLEPNGTRNQPGNIFTSAF